MSRRDLQSVLYSDRAVGRAFTMMYAGRVGLALTNFVLSVLIVRTLSVDDYGVLQLVIALALILRTATTFGLPAAAARYLPELLGKRNQRAALVVFGRVLAVRGLLAAITATLLVVFWDVVRDFVSLPEGTLLLGAFVAVQLFLGSVGDVIGNALLTSLMRQGTFQLGLILGQAATALLCAVALAFGGGVPHLVCAYAAGAFVQVAFFAVHAHQWWPAGVSPRELFTASWPVSPWRILHFAFPIYVSSLGSTVLARAFDVVFVSVLLGSQQRAFYAFCSMLPAQVASWMPSAMFGAALIPAVVGRLAGLSPQERGGRLKGIFGEVVVLLLFICGPVSAVGAVLAPQFVSYLYDPKYSPVSTAFGLAMLFVIARVLCYALDPVIRTLEVTWVYLVGLGVSACKLVLVFPIVAQFGVTGLVVLSGGSYVLLFVSQYLLVRRRAELGLPWARVGRLALNLAAMAGVLLAIRPVVDGPGGLALAVAVGVLTYGLVSVLNPVVSRSVGVRICKAAGLPAGLTRSLGVLMR